MTGSGHLSFASQLDGGEFGALLSTPVDTATMRRSLGGPPDPIHCTSRGTSTLQCGHQWATKATSVGCGLGPPTVTGLPSNDWPARVGASWPMPGSGALASCGYGARFVPCTVTGRVCASGTVVPVFGVARPGGDGGTVTA